jgi:hypothetical protein
MYLPANPTRRRREEEFLVRARLEVIDSKIDAMLAKAREKAAKEPSTPPQDPRVAALARAMGHEDYHFPTGAIPSLTFDDDEIVCTGLTIEGRFWSIEHIVALKLINERGAWLWSRYSAITYALPPVTDCLQRPWHAATVSGRPHL